MKRLLLITPEPVHRFLYEPQLKHHFEVEFSPSVAGVVRTVDAVVYDLPRSPSKVDRDWIEAQGLPVVCLCAGPWVELPRGANLRVIYYPVKLDELLQALESLGVVPGKEQ